MSRPIRHWLMKTEADCFPITELERVRKTGWDGVRNYQARNYMMEEMNVGDLVLFYHSNAFPSGVAGIARVCKSAHPDQTAWDPYDQHYDPASSPENPRWYMVDVEFVEKFPKVFSLQQMREIPELAEMLVLRKGQRLSVMPVDPEHYRIVVEAARKG